MKKFLFALIFLMGVAQLRIGLGNENQGEVAVGHRPFSWYYPYSYQYYYPRHHYEEQPSYYAGGCYWVYIEGSYYYYCQQ